MARSPLRADPRKILAFLALAIVARTVHDLLEFGAPGTDWILTGVLIPVGLTAAWWWHANLRSVWRWLLVAWLIIVVVGGALTVAPVGWLPFESEQTAGHYGAHVIFAAGQVPLLWYVFRLPTWADDL